MFTFRAFIIVLQEKDDKEQLYKNHIVEDVQVYTVLLNNLLIVCSTK